MMPTFIHVPRERTRHKAMRLLLIALCGCFVCARVSALTRDRDITQFHHTAWLAREGAPSQINAVVQTTDGYLWFGSERGLFQFDGVQFRSFEPPAGMRFPSSNINSLMATPDGGLWISFNPSGIGYLKDGRFVLFDQPRFELASFARGLDGRIWAGTRTGLFLLDGNEWREVARDWNFTGQRVWAMFVDRSGTLWVAMDNALVFLRRGSSKFQPTGTRVAGAVSIGQARDGQLWVSQFGGPLQVLDDEGRVLKFPRIQFSVTHFLFDRDGSLWMVGFLKGVGRLRFPERLGNRTVTLDSPEVEWFTQKDGLTDNTMNDIFEDREGNIWATSNTGVNRFRYSRLVPVKLPAPSRYATLVAGNHGDVWIGSDVLAPFRNIRRDEFMASGARARVSSVYQASENTVWWGGIAGIWRQQNERFDFFPQPPRLPSDWIWEVFPDDRNGGLWVAAGDFGLIHFKDGVWTFPPLPEGLPNLIPSASFEETAGRTWLGYDDDQVFLLTRDGVRKYSRPDGLDIGRVRVIRGHGLQMFFGGELGLAVLQEGRFTVIRGPEERPLGAVTGIVEAADGSVWLNEQHGILRILPSDVLQLAKDPNHVVVPEVYDFLDGLPGAAQTQFRSSTAIQASDGRWFATDNGLAWVDPAHMRKNTVPPSVAITGLRSESRKYPVSEALRLPKGTRALRIEYTGLSFSIPERVRFKYKLAGVEQDWHDAGNRREAVYNNLGPGPYEFRVIAANNDGVWNEVGAFIDFSIAPAFYQTTWFRLLCVAAFLALLWVLYQLRLRQLQKGYDARLEERVGERTRIARELHDTLLQSFQGLMLRFQAVDEMLSTSPTDAKKALEGALERADQALLEGRDAIKDMRAPSTSGDLAQSMNALMTDLHKELAIGKDGPVTFRVLVEGAPQTVRPALRDEIYLIAREALRNAFRYAQARQIETEITYGDRLLRLRVRDDGKGIDAHILERGGRSGHWGLVGMRERAKRIGGQLDVWSKAGAGTEVELSIPGSIAYGAPGKRGGFWLFGKDEAKL
jgi:signal transduction histidine kinase/ligand-binding sensor domain-containing protein